MLSPTNSWWTNYREMNTIKFEEKPRETLIDNNIFLFPYEIYRFIGKTGYINVHYLFINYFRLIICYQYILIKHIDCGANDNKDIFQKKEG